MLKEGADILDIGGQSTRPGAEQVSINEELQTGDCRRLKQFIAYFPDAIISIDTYHAEIARKPLRRELPW